MLDGPPPYEPVASYRPSAYCAVDPGWSADADGTADVGVASLCSGVQPAMAAVAARPAIAALALTTLPRHDAVVTGISRNSGLLSISSFRPRGFRGRRPRASRFPV